jgi:nucleoside-diphosphate-sugar epimerase
MSIDSNAILLTGYPNLLARRLLEKILERQLSAQVICATAPTAMENAREHLATLPEPFRHRVYLCPYDVTAMDFGLSGTDFFSLAERVALIHHCASAVRSGLDSAEAERLNLRTAGEVLELAKIARGLKQLFFWSSALVSGSRRGVVSEDELVRPARFNNPAYETIFRAEALIRKNMAVLPITIFRPSLMVGCAKNGETEPFEEPHLLIQFILNAPTDIPVLLPKRGETFLHMVPADFVVEAGYAIANNPRSLGRTFHLIDPRPLKVRQILELVSEKLGKTYEISELPTALASALLRAPGLRRWLELPRTLIEQLADNIVYDNANTNEILHDEEIPCPPVSSYISTLIETVNRV